MCSARLRSLNDAFLRLSEPQQQFLRKVWTSIVEESRDIMTESEDSAGKSDTNLKESVNLPNSKAEKSSKQNAPSSNCEKELAKETRESSRNVKSGEDEEGKSVEKSNLCTSINNKKLMVLLNRQDCLESVKKSPGHCELFSEKNLTNPINRKPSFKNNKQVSDEQSIIPEKYSCIPKHSFDLRTRGATGGMEGYETSNYMTTTAKCVNSVKISEPMHKSVTKKKQTLKTSLGKDVSSNSGVIKMNYVQKADSCNAKTSKDKTSNFVTTINNKKLMVLLNRQNCLESVQKSSGHCELSSEKKLTSPINRKPPFKKNEHVSDEQNIIFEKHSPIPTHSFNLRSRGATDGMPGNKTSNFMTTTAKCVNSVKISEPMYKSVSKKKQKLKTSLGKDVSSNSGFIKMNYVQKTDSCNDRTFEDKESDLCISTYKEFMAFLSRQCCLESEHKSLGHCESFSEKKLASPINRESSFKNNKQASDEQNIILEKHSHIPKHSFNLRTRGATDGMEGDETSNSMATTEKCEDNIKISKHIHKSVTEQKQKLKTSLGKDASSNSGFVKMNYIEKTNLYNDRTSVDNIKKSEFKTSSSLVQSQPGRTSVECNKIILTIENRSEVELDPTLSVKGNRKRAYKDQESKEVCTSSVVQESSYFQKSEITQINSGNFTFIYFPSNIYKKLRIVNADPS